VARPAKWLAGGDARLRHFIVAPNTFDELVAEGAAVPVEGWDFSWFEGRATEERAPWGYSRLLAGGLSTVGAALDVQTGGGEVLAEALARASPGPGHLAATESWPPNLEIARRNLGPYGGVVMEVGDAAALPFGDETFDLVVSRHPVVTVWEEVARVLRRGGSYMSQQVGDGSNRELYEFMMGPQPAGSASSPRRPDLAVKSATAAGLVVTDLRQASLRVVFYDIGAVVHFLRKVLWTVPGFTVDQYRDRLLAMHEVIHTEGQFVSHAQRFLIEAEKRS
jgi:SAM-dependent methyltransferase